MQTSANCQYVLIWQDWGHTGIKLILFEFWGARGGVVGWDTVLQFGGLRIRITGIVQWLNSVVDSACNRNEYQEYLQESKAAGLTTLPPSCRLSCKLPPGTLRSCQGLLYLWVLKTCRIVMVMWTTSKYGTISELVETYMEINQPTVSWRDCGRSINHRSVRAVGLSVQTRTVTTRKQHPSSKPIQYKYDKFKVQVLKYVVLCRRNSVKCNYSGTSVHEFNSFLEAVRHPKCS
jgi:hypothetical protein